ncbi:MAG: hypothetical protein AAF903_10675 [Pseudomonadota bacterium]
MKPSDPQQPDGIFIGDNGCVTMRHQGRCIHAILEPEDLRSFAAAMVDIADDMEARASGPAADAIGRAMGHA